MQNTETGLKVDISLCSQLVFSGNVTDRANVTGMKPNYCFNDRF